MQIRTRSSVLGLSLLLSAGLSACVQSGQGAKDPVVVAPSAGKPTSAAAPALLSCVKPVLGRWRSRLDGSALEFSATRFFHSFPYSGGERENYAAIVGCTDSGRIIIRYDKILDSGTPVALHPEDDFVDVEVRQGLLYKWISPNPEPQAVSDEAFERVTHQLAQ